jgi:hypothetical protein
MGATATILSADQQGVKWAIARCLDHAKKGDVIVPMPTVTGKVYNHSKRMNEKRAVLDGVAAELPRIIGRPEVKAIGRDEYGSPCDQRSKNTRRRSKPSILVRRRRHFAGPENPSAGLLQGRHDGVL